MTKIWCCFFMVFVSYNCWSQKKDENSKIIKIEVRKIELMATVISSLNCEDFEKYMNVDTFFVTDTNIQKIMLNAISRSKEIKKYSEDDKYPLDIRARIYLYRKNSKVDVLCINAGKKYYLNGKLREFKDDEFVDIVDGLRKKR